MAQLLMIILNDTKLLPDLLQAWRDVGVPGTTILSSAGGHRTRNLFSRIGLGALDNLFERKEVEGKTLMATFEDEELLAKAIGEAERVVGGFDRPDSGLLMVLPVTQALGIFKAEPKEEKAPPPALRQNWAILRDTPIEKLNAMMDLKPTVVNLDTPLEEIASAMAQQPRVHVASVISSDDRLVGLLTLRTLANSLFFHILPEEFISEITDVEKMMDFASRTRRRTAEDAMKPAVWVKRGETAKDAFIRMHDNDLPGLPLVDERYHVIGYINLLELVGLFMSEENDASGKENA
ncbi:MAG: CBS domain-containing protein [Anaerolineae bacterium]|jgi:CBS domain-containing protein|nr:CBS domain-containing protein [Anaerolineae bacterium]MBT7072561.1 CBS domain-containing protein [Anaerolineae bacterium]MBT7324613.1 CBS domain-containing protein [Anaerolineae bacterium]